MVQAVETLEAARVLGVAVFDVLAFIGDDRVEGHVVIERCIAAQGGVAGEQQGAWRYVGEQRGALFFAADDDAVRQAWRKAFKPASQL